MNVNVALIDNQILFRKGLKEVLHSFGDVRVKTETDNWQQLAGKLRNIVLPHLCIVSSNALMQNDNEAVSELKRRFPDMKLLIIPNYFSEITMMKMLRDGADGYVMKNAQPAELKRAILNIVKKGSHWPKITDELRASARSRSAQYYRINKKHLQVLIYCQTDLSYDDIAKIMKISTRAVEGYRDMLFKKFQVSSRPALVAAAIKSGAVELS